MALTFWTPTTGTELLLLLVSFGLSSVVGLERRFEQKSAGVRTHVLVAVGSTAFTLVSAHGFAGDGSPGAGGGSDGDPSRIAAQVVSGVGFLGAGVIFTRRNAVRGLTTAATIWVSAAIGMACGAGMPAVAVAVTALHLLVALVVSPLTDRLPTRDRNRVLTVRYLDGRGVLRSVLAASSDMGFSSAILATSTSTSTSTSTPDAGSGPAVAVRARFRGRRPLSDLVLTISELDGVLGVDAWSVRVRDDPEDDDA